MWRKQTTHSCFISALIALACAAISGCSAGHPSAFAKLAVFKTSDLGIMPEEYELLNATLDKAVAERTKASPDGPGVYNRKNFELIALHRLPPQKRLPEGGAIISGMAVESGVDEVQRYDLTADVFKLPGKEPSVTTGGVPSKGGVDKHFDVYDLGRDDRLLVIAQGDMSPMGNFIKFILWDALSGKTEYLWGCAGEETGVDFSYELAVTPQGPEMTVRGILTVKRLAYEKDSVVLSKKLGMPVRFIYDESRL
jgi:hypothetical protein